MKSNEIKRAVAEFREIADHLEAVDQMLDRLDANKDLCTKVEFMRAVLDVVNVYRSIGRTPPKTYSGALADWMELMEKLEKVNRYFEAFTRVEKKESAF